MSQDYFLNMIRLLREQEKIILYGNLLDVGFTENIEVKLLLEQLYLQEKLNYPFEAPAFNSEAALWGAKMIYVSAQLILYRENASKDLEVILPDYSTAPSASEQLSADLCLRFLPHLLFELRLIDPEDKLLEILEKKLLIWHYSGIKCNTDADLIDLENFPDDNCYRQLYLNRILVCKNKPFASHPFFQNKVLADLGIHGAHFWKELNFDKPHYETN